MTDTGAAPADGWRTNSRAALIEAAIDEFSAKGYEAATVAEIAEQAGVTTGALYAHFEGKLDLLQEALGLQTVDQFLRAAAWATTRPWSEVSRLIGRDMARPPDRRALLLLDVIVLARREPDVAAALREGFDDFLRAIVQAIDQSEEAGLVEPALDVTELARLLSCLGSGTMVLSALDEELPSEATFIRFLDLVLQAEHHDTGEEPAALARVRARANQAERARRDLASAVAQAREAGHSLRQIGDAAGVSHEQVRRILREGP